MAINPSTQYPGKIDTTDANYPYGKAQNITAPGDGTGTPWEKAIVNDVLGMQQALLKSSGIVPSGAADKVTASQYLQSVVELISGRAFNYTASGTANAIILTAQTNQESPQSLFIGLQVRFKASASNTGTTTINVVGLGVRTIKLVSGGNLITGDIVFNSNYTLVYNGVNFILDDTRRAKNVALQDLAGYYAAADVEAALAELRPDRGTFSPTMEGFTTAGTGWVYSAQNGRWTRTGKILSIDFIIQITTIGSGAAGIPAISNLPFTGDWDPSVDIPGSISGINGVTLDQANDFSQLLMKADVSAGKLVFQQMKGSSWKWMDITDLTTVLQIAGHVTISLT